MKRIGRYRMARILRTLIAVASLAAVTGGLVFGFTTLAMHLQIIPAIVALHVGAVVLWAAVTLLIGRIYCSTICPLGTIQDAVSRLGLARMRWLMRRRGLSPSEAGYHHHPPLSRVRSAVLLLAIGVLVVGSPMALTVFDPMELFEHALPDPATIAAVSATSIVIAWVAIAALVAPAALRGRIVCNSICPLGTVLGTVGRVALFHPDINTDTCIGCGECVRVCKAECIDPSAHTIDLSRCVMCFDCMDRCPEHAITLRRGRHTLSSPMMQTAGPNNSDNIQQDHS